MKSRKYVDQFGNETWRLPDGTIHREDGPAIIGSNGCHQLWLINGELHRTDGPAVIWTNGDKRWHLKNKRYTEKEFNEKIRILKDLEETLKDLFA